MGKSIRPGDALALALSIACTPAWAQETSSTEDKAGQRPLTPVEIRAERESADQEHLDLEALSRYRGTSNADVLSKVVSVQMNNLRNEGGSIDVGIRGLQGEGRVPVVIDGALQSTHTHRGYQGESDRTYIDMDLVRSVTVTKGPSSGDSAGAIGGLVQMRTIEADDVLLPGQTFGILARASIYNNNHMPEVPATAVDQQYYFMHNGQSQDHFSNGAGSIALAGRHDRVQWLLAHSRRRDGNYFAGRHGVERYGEQAIVGPGEEVVNTSYESNSSLAKLALTPRAGHKLEFIWRHHEQKAGEVMAAYWFKNTKDGRFPSPWPSLPPGVQSMPQWNPGGARLNAYSVAYSLTPTDNPLLDLKLSLWRTDLVLDQFNGLFSGAAGAQHAEQYRHRYGDMRHGISLANRSMLADGSVVFDYGVSAAEQRTAPINYIPAYPQSRATSRDARRSDYAMWVSGELNASRATIKLGARMHGAAISDYSVQRRTAYAPRTDLMADLLAPLGAGVELYGKAAHAWRNPSLFESSTSGQVFSYDHTNPLKPEQNRSWELGLKGKWREPAFAGTVTAKAGYFSNSVTDYISGAELPRRPDMEEWENNLTLVNYDKLELKGWEARLAYDARTFFADIAGIVYDQPRVCSRRLAEQDDEPGCNAEGYRWSLISTRIPPRRSFSIGAGVRLFEQRLVLGGRMRYHARKTNPSGWLAGTGANAVMEVPSERLLDVFAEFRVNQNVRLAFNVDNLQNRYAYDPGTVISKPMPGRTVRLNVTGQF